MTNVLYEITRSAVERMLQTGESPGIGLYDEDEEAKLQATLQEVWGTSYLFGESQMQLRAEQAIEANAKKKPLRSTDPTDLSTFGDSLPVFTFDDILDNLIPKTALDYFMGLVPSLDIDVMRFGELLERKAFTLAAATSERMLGQVQKSIGAFYQGGKVIGRGKTGLAGEINDILNNAGVTPKNPQYAEMVARTNLMDGMTTGLQKRQQAVKDTFPAWKYSSIATKEGKPRDGRTRPTHAARNGMIFPVDIPFTEVRGTDIKDVANCILPGMIASGTVQAASKAWYSGEVVELTLRSGTRLSLTSQHPVMTDRGFVSAGQLKQGDNLARTLVDRKLLPARHDVQYDPTAIDQIFDAFKETGSLRVKRSSRLDFYGDGRFFDGQIEIVGADGFLRSRRHSKTQECVGQRNLIDTNVRQVDHSLDRPFRKSRSTVFLPSPRGMSRRDLLPLFSFAHLAPLEFLSLGTTTDRYASSDQPATNNSSIHTVYFGQRVLTGTANVVFDDLVHIKRSHYSGYVYDLQTSTGVFACSQDTKHSGIVVKNCRCVPIPLDKWELEEFLSKGGKLNTLNEVPR